MYHHGNYRDGGRALVRAVGLAAMALCCTSLLRAAEPPGKNAVSVPELVSVEKIWDKAKHCAFTDLIRYQGKWFCTFREGLAHARDDGKARVIVSADGEEWESAALLAEPGIDLRDPKVSITPDGRLMMVMGGTIWRESRYLSRHSRVAFSTDGHAWTPTQTVLGDGDWLWRVTWHDGKAYGVSYNPDHWKETKQPSQTLVVSSDGVKYDKICTLDVTAYAGETTLRFQPDGTMIALVRRYHPGVVLLVGVAVGLGLGLPGAFLRAFTAELGIPRMAMFFTAYAGTALVTRITTRRLPERFGLKPMILLGLGLMIASQLLFLGVRTEWQLIVPGMVYGMSHAVIFPPTVAAGVQHFPGRYRGLATMVTLSTCDVGLLVGAPMAGAILHYSVRFGLPAYPTLFISQAIFLGLVATTYTVAQPQPRPLRPVAARPRPPEPLFESPPTVEPLLEVCGPAECTAHTECSPRAER